MIDLDASKPRSRRAGARRKPLMDPKFSSYLSFGFHTTVCLGLFLGFYAFVLLFLTPLLHEEAPKTADLRRGEVLRPVVDPLVEKMKHMPHVPGQYLAEEMAGALKRRIHSLRIKQGVSDASLMKKASDAANKFRIQRQQGEEGAIQQQVAEKEHQVPPVSVAALHQRKGCIILGMHRSGTSMLAGLMATGLDYNTGGPLIGEAFDNEKGFFERVDVVLQNDEFMRLQRVWWAAEVLNYDAERAITDKRAGRVMFKEGEKALAFLNNPDNTPWIQKDPRMCITLKTWLPLLKSEPAILFTYRNPLEVAKSLKKRERNFSLERGLRLWIAYNMRALQNSAKLCRVMSSNDAILADPLKEVQRISDELTTKCGLPKPPGTLTQEEVDKFVDPNLQHKERRTAEKPIISEAEGCVIRDYDSDVAVGTPEYEQLRKVYLVAMKVHCDLKSGQAYNDNYQWPTMQ